MAGRAQELPTFEEVAVYLSRAEWELAAEEQRELYRSVMLDNFALLASLGYAGPKPDLLYRLERGEEPWVCAPRGPATWDGPGSPTPGCDEDGRQPEEPCFTWWPSAGRRRALEESTQPPGHGGRREPWRLRCSRLLKKFGDPGGKAQAEAAGGRAPPVGSPEWAQAGSRSGKEEAEDDRGTRPGLGGGTGLPLPPVPRHSAADPYERPGPDRRETLQGGAQEALHAAGDGSLPPAGEDVDGAPVGDHCYCTRPEALLQHSAAFLPALREHDYCGDGESGASALRDHDYCQVWTLPWQGRARKAACPTCCARAELRRLCKRKWREGRDGGKGTRARRRLRPCFRSLRLSRGYFCADCLFAPTLPASAHPARAEDPTKDTRGVFWPSAEWATVIPQPQEERHSRGGTPEAPRTPAASREPSAGEARGGAAQPEVWVRYRARGRRPPRPWWDLARRELVAPSQASLCNACDGAMRTRNWGLCTVCLSSATCRARRGRPRLPRPAAEHLSPISRACPVRGEPPGRAAQEAVREAHRGEWCLRGSGRGHRAGGEARAPGRRWGQGTAGWVQRRGRGAQKREREGSCVSAGSFCDPAALDRRGLPIAWLPPRAEHTVR